MLLSAVSVLVVAQSSSEIPEGLMNNPVCSEQSSRAQCRMVMSSRKASFNSQPVSKSYVLYGPRKFISVLEKAAIIHYPKPDQSTTHPRLLIFER